MTVRKIVTVVVMSIGLLLVPNSTTAFASGYTLSGQVKDPYGFGVAGVTVGLQSSQGTSFIAGETSVTDGSGNYSISGIAGGAYYLGVHIGGVLYAPSDSHPQRGPWNAPQNLRVDTTATKTINADTPGFDLTIPEKAVRLGAVDDYLNPVAGVSFDVSSVCPQPGLSLGGLPASGCSSYSTAPNSQGKYQSPVPLTDNSGFAGASGCSGNCYWLIPSAPNPFSGSNPPPNPYLYTVTAHSYHNYFGLGSGCYYSATYTMSLGPSADVTTARASFCPWQWAPYQSVTSVMTGYNVTPSTCCLQQTVMSLAKPQTETGRITTPNGDPVSGVKVILEASRGGNAIAAQTLTDGNGNYSLNFEPVAYNGSAWVNQQYYLRVQADINGNQTNVAQSFYVETTTPQSFAQADSRLINFNDGHAASAYPPQSGLFCGLDQTPFPLYYFEGFGGNCDEVDSDSGFVLNPPFPGNPLGAGPPYTFNPQAVTSTLNVTLPEHKVSVTVEGETSPGVFTTPQAGFTLGTNSLCSQEGAAWNGTLNLQTTGTLGALAVNANGCSLDSPSASPALSTNGSGQVDMWLLSTLPNPQHGSGPYTITAAAPGGSVYLTGTSSPTDVQSSDQSITINVKHVRPQVACVQNGTPGFAPWWSTEVSYTCNVTDDRSGASTPSGSFTLTTNIGAGNISQDAFTPSQSTCDPSGFCTVSGPFPTSVASWNPATQYFINNVVQYNGVYYVALQTSTNQQPNASPTYWTVTHVGFKIDRQGPMVSCNPSARAVYGAGQGVPCTATEGGDGLLHPSDQSFQLLPNPAVPANTVNLSATTATHMVCDHLNQCVTVGPYTIAVDTAPPAITCSPAGPYNGTWYAANQTVTCNASEASDPYAALSNPADATFTVSTNVPAGTTTSSAYTGAHQVCNTLGTCITVGPLGPFKIARGGPTATIITPSVGAQYVLAQGVSSSFSCSDGTGPGLTSCVGPGNSASGAPLNTGTVGPQTFVVTATDTVGNVSTTSRAYTVTYNVCPLVTSVTAASGGPLAVELCDASNTDASTAARTLTAVKLTQIGGENNNFPLNNAFTFSAGLGPSGAYTLTLPGWAAGNYMLYFRVSGDPVVHSVNITLT